MSLRALTAYEKQQVHQRLSSVRSAWIADIQIRRMRPQTCMQPGFQRSMLKMTKSDGLPAPTECVPRSIFERAAAG